MKSIIEQNLIRDKLIIINKSQRWQLVKLHGLSILIIILLFMDIDPIAALFVGGIINFFVYIYIGIKEFKSSPFGFTPISFYFIWYAINLGVSAVYIASELADDGRISFSTALLYPSQIINGFVIFSIGAFFLHIGLQLNRPAFEKINEQAKPRFTSSAFILFIIIGLIYDFNSAFLGSIGAIIAPLRFSIITALALLAFNKGNLFKISEYLKERILILGSIAVFILNMSTTSKAYMMYAFFPLLWVLLIQKKNRFKLFGFITVLVVVYFTFVFPLSYELRTQARFNNKIDYSSAVEKVISGDNSSIDYDQRNKNPVYAYLSRSFEPAAVAYLYSEVEKYGYMNGVTMYYLAYALVPRIIWSNKPILAQGAWFAYYLGFAVSPEKSTVSLGITAVGEFFWNFGIIGVIIGMFIIGILYSGLWKLAGTEPQKSILSMLLYINILFGMVNMSEAGTVIIATAILFIGYKAAIFVRDNYFSKN